MNKIKWKWNEKRGLILWMGVALLMLSVSPLLGSNGSKNEKGGETPKLTLVESVMCEKIVNQAPVNPSVVFPVTVNNAYCYTLFDGISGKTIVWHKWYRKDQLVTKIKLVLEPARWSTHSGITIRESDKGPWRVEIIDKEGNLLGVKRFSISD